MKETFEKTRKIHLEV